MARLRRWAALPTALALIEHWKHDLGLAERTAPNCLIRRGGVPLTKEDISRLLSRATAL